MTTTQTLLLVHAGATLFMVGLIWTIQVVHYPLFAKVGEGGYSAYQHEHMTRIGWVVGPMMIVEAASAVGLLVIARSTVQPMLLWAGLGLLLVIWLSTALLQAPIHYKLTRQFDPAWVRKLVGTNWIRTAAWTARGVLALALLADKHA
jgi:hypothetical protein